MPLITSDLEFSDDYPTIEPSIRLDFANARALDPRITFTRASVATYVDKNGLIKTVGVDEPRFDHDPTTGESLGLLIEESRTNLIAESIVDPNSGLTSPAYWTPQEFSSPTQVTDPFGSNNAYQYLSTGGNVRSRILSAGNSNPTQPDSVVGQQYTFSIFAKTVNYDTISFGSSAAPWGTDSTRVLFNLTTGTVVSDISTMGSVSSASMIPYGDGWWRLVVTSIPATVAVGIRLYIDLGLRGSTDDTHTTSEGLQLFGAQMETGAFSTSYIPTSGSTVTRAADLPYIEGTSFSSWYNPEGGAYVLDVIAYSYSSSFFGFGTSSYLESFNISNSGGTQFYVAGNYNTSNAYTGNMNLDQSNKIGASFNSTGQRVCSNGQSVNASSFSPPDTSLFTDFDRLSFGGNIPWDKTYTSQRKTHVKSFSYYPKYLSDAQLKALTQ